MSSSDTEDIAISDNVPPAAPVAASSAPASAASVSEGQAARSEGESAEGSVRPLILNPFVL